MIKNYRGILCLFTTFLMTSCGTYFNQPFETQKARLGEVTVANTELANLPAAKEKVVVGVYKFRDQTGQYKPVENGTSWSTAITQGTTSILIKALEDSKWFTPIERENVGNLLNERQIIRTTRQQYSNNSKAKEQPQLPPLLYAGVLLEGGVISYDSNIVTGGIGARYFGIGASTQYRQDRITVYLRAISTQNGKILKTVYVSKTILSQAVDASVFRYIKFKRLLEAETGFTKNEPVQLAVTEAIEKAVSSLVIEGIEDKIWPPADEEAGSLAVKNYNLEKDLSEDTGLHERLFKDRRSKNAVGIAAVGSLIDGDFGDAQLQSGVSLNYKRKILKGFYLSGETGLFSLKNENVFSNSFLSLGLDAVYIVLPYDRFSPYITAGTGVFGTTNFDDITFKVQYGLGLEYMAAKNLGVKLYGEQNISLDDTLDGLDRGKRNDFFWRFGLGINYYF
ncbi:CsgG/HfaB family protein [Ascidiimonas sp. W6]|uniref:CsgG/HfaB family protein n=1 Tax=Ascidiimonas meishanensis TaxID=3128903 RepID=UPI0030ECDB24